MRQSKPGVSSGAGNPESDDEESVQMHLSELNKELKRKNYDKEKVARLLSLTYSSRRTTMLSHSASICVDSLLQSFPCLRCPIFVSMLYY